MLRLSMSTGWDNVHSQAHILPMVTHLRRRERNLRNPFSGDSGRSKPYPKSASTSTSTSPLCFAEWSPELQTRIIFSSTLTLVRNAGTKKYGSRIEKLGLDYMTTCFTLHC